MISSRELQFFEGAHCSSQGYPILTKAEFEGRKLDRIKRLSLAAAEVGAWLPKLNTSYHSLRLTIPKSSSLWQTSLNDVHQQLDWLFQSIFSGILLGNGSVNTLAT